MHDFEAMKRAVETVAPDQLDGITKALYAALAEGQLSEDEAEQIEGLLSARRSPARGAPQPMCFLAQATSQLVAVPPSPEPAAPAAGSGTHPRRGSRPRTPESLPRRRRLAAAGYLPPALAAAFTAGEQAVLAIIAMEVAKRGKCTLANRHLAALAGVGVTLVKRAVRQARTLGLLSVEERRLSRWRSETNVLRVISREWSSWLRTRLPRTNHPGFAGGGGTNGSATNVSSSRGANSSRNGGGRQVREELKAQPEMPERIGKREAGA